MTAVAATTRVHRWSVLGTWRSSASMTLPLRASSMRTSSAAAPDSEAALAANHRIGISAPGRSRQRLPGLLARQWCSCGCGTIELRPRHGMPAFGAPSPVPSEGIVLDTSGEVAGGLLLFLHNGLLLSLEVYSYGDPLVMPDPSVASTFRWNPVHGCDNPATAIRRADGFARAVNMTGTEDPSFWAGKASSYLWCLFPAGSDGRRPNDEPGLGPNRLKHPQAMSAIGQGQGQPEASCMRP